MDLRSIINTEAVEGSSRRQATPITPVQSSAPHRSFREQSHPPQTSQDQGQPYPSNSYKGTYQSRPPAPPPLQPPSRDDRRSPASASQYSAQSPYQHQSVSGSQYPFPSQTPQSPSHPHPYSSTLPQRESYTQSNQHSPRTQNQGLYGQPSPTPNTPVGTPGGTNAYYPQRSQSSQSTSTPTSAQSQPFYNQFSQDSPISTGSFHQGQPLQQSHPTPLGPPISNPRQPSGSFPQPTSPYHQRPRSSGVLIPPYSAARVSPAPQHPPQQRQLSTPSISESHHSFTDTSSRRSREQSMSVSPKTQPPGLPSAERLANEPPKPENGHIPTPKRKLDDGGVDDSIPNPKATNGDQPAIATATLMSGPTKKRMRYNEPPIWARSVTGRVKGNPKRYTDGKQPMKSLPNQFEPEANGDRQMLSTLPKSQLQAPQTDNKGDGTLGPWEPSIMGIRPYEEISKLVADWLFVTVVNREDAGELASRGVEVEIEAKLGQLINKDTNDRFYLPVKSECILLDTGRVSFQSSMTEAQHKLLNDFLNDTVKETYPGNPNRTKPRVPVMYTHRRERDTFFELPRPAHATLPGCMRAVVNPRHTVKVRVTHDQRSGQLLAKIIKARVANLDIYNPQSLLDCRISVNLEMKYDGDVENLVTPQDSPRMPDRNKDRLSYNHTHYQIDLTQVTVADPNSRTEKEHELEIELSATAVREQGRRAAVGEPHQYAELIEGLIDNVRVLTRKVTLGLG